MIVAISTWLKILIASGVLLWNKIIPCCFGICHDEARIVTFDRKALVLINSKFVLFYFKQERKTFIRSEANIARNWKTIVNPEQLCLNDLTNGLR